MLNDLLDVLRDHGWSDTGPDHDPVKWLKDHWRDVLEAQHAQEDAERDAERERERADEAESKLQQIRELTT